MRTANPKTKRFNDAHTTHPLGRQFGSPDATLIASETPLGSQYSSRAGIRVPDLMVAFSANPRAIMSRRGYAIQDPRTTWPRSRGRGH